MGGHQVECLGNGDHINKHDALRDILFAIAQSASLAPQKELTELIPGSAIVDLLIFPAKLVQGAF